MKRYALPLFAIVLVSFLSCNNKTSTDTSKAEQTSINDTVPKFTAMKFIFKYSPGNPGGRVIPPGEATDMIKLFQGKFTPGTSPVKGDDDQNLHGFFIGKGAFASLNDHPDLDGVMAYIAKPRNAPENVYTLVFVPTKIKDLKTGEMEEHPEYGMWEEIDPCPKMCGALGK